MSETHEDTLEEESVAQQETDLSQGIETDVPSEFSLSEDETNTENEEDAVPSEQDIEEPEENTSTTALNLGSTCVLLVDDDEDTANLVIRSIEGFGITNVVRVATAATAYFQLTEDKELFPDLVILELVLPGMTGIQFLAKLRSDPDLRIRNLPVVVLTEVDSSSVYQRVTNQNIGAYLRKPVSAGALEVAIANTLSGKVIEPPLAFGRSWIDEIEDRQDSTSDADEPSWFRRMVTGLFGGKGSR